MGSWTVRKFSILFVILLIGLPRNLLAQSGGYFGRYVIDKVQILEKDLVVTLPHEDLAVQVKLEDSTVFVELEKGTEKEAIVFQLLRKEDIKETKDDGEEVLAGIKAFQNTNGVLKHLLLTQEYLQITSFIPNSDVTRITYAKRSF